MDYETQIEFRRAHIGELAARRQGASEFAIVCAVVLGIGIAQLFGVNLTLCIIIFAPPAIFIGVGDYIKYGRQINGELKKIKELEGRKNKDE